MYYKYPVYEDRFGFVVPFLLGGLGGAAIAGASRPRPVFVNPPMNYPMPYTPYYSYSNYYNY